MLEGSVDAPIARAKNSVAFWALVLALQASTVVFTALPATIDGARLSARVAEDIDAQVKHSGLDVHYLVQDDFSLCQSAATTVFKAALMCGYNKPCSPVKRASLISTMAHPYYFVLPHEPFATPAGPFLILYVDYLGDESSRPLPPREWELVEATVGCRAWQQHAHRIHLCRSPAVT